MRDLLGPMTLGIGLFAALTCTVGNLAAYRQASVKRMLAYSSIAHAGYMLMAAAILTSTTNAGIAAVVAYLIVYLDRLWTLELNWYGRQAAGQQKGLAVIEALFRYTAIQIQKKPGLMGEIIAHEARIRTRQTGPEITQAERIIAFADLEDIDSLPDDSLENLLRSSLEAAIKQGELPENTAIAAAMVGLVSIFYGVPLAMQYANPAAIGAMYRQQLALLGAGLRAVVEK